VVKDPRNLLPRLAEAVGFYADVITCTCVLAIVKADYGAEMVTRRNRDSGLAYEAQYLRLH
jgi:hypothetical protein